jgi:multisubunit Na+/H+ antiporter MnhF subunit
MISDGIDGSVSSKRVVTLIALSLVVLAFILNLFWDFTVEEYMYNSMMVIVLGGLGTTVAEKFSKK